MLCQIPQKHALLPHRFILPMLAITKNSLPPLSGRGIIPPSKSRGLAFVYIIVLMVP